MSNEEQKKYKIDLMNRILKDLLELQLIYFDDDNKFHFITDIISKYSFLVYEEVKNNVKN
mgnify:CR=1 FL=1